MKSIIIYAAIALLLIGIFIKKLLDFVKKITDSRKKYK